MNFVPLTVHSHYSLLEGLSKPHTIAERCVNLGYSACAITDKGTLAGTVSFTKALKDVCKCGHQKTIHADKKKCSQKGCGCMEFTPYKIKPILGSQFYITEKPAKVKDASNRATTELTILSKNIDGWKGLIKASSEAARPEHVYYNIPRIDAASFAAYSQQKNWIAISGNLGSYIGNVIFGDNIKFAYNAPTYEDAKGYVVDDWKKRITDAVGSYNELFGQGNFYLDINLTNSEHQPASIIVSKTLRWIGKKLGIPCVGNCNSYYPNKHQSIDQRLLLCMKYKGNFSNIDSKLSNSKDAAFFKSKSYHIPSQEEILSIYSEEEIRNSFEISEQIQSYNILVDSPYLPSFECPNGLTQEEYLKKLCADGWHKRIQPIVKNAEHKKVYSERVKRELDVLCSAKLSGYFLIVQDYCNWARSKGWLLGPGRGSGAGSLVSYLLGITQADPIPASLIFERFYNAGRNTPDRIALPDIDSDFPKFHRDEVIAYIESKYGVDKVSQMITFGTIKGRGAIKSVFGIHQALPFEEINKISKMIPQEASIADHLQLMREATGEASSIRWTLENNPASLKDWCYLTESGELDGPFAKLFEQAIRLEGTKKQSGKHASGIIISKEPLSDVCPMSYDKNDDQIICGMEMNDLEAMGHVKFDILGVAVLDKIMEVQKLVKYGDLDD